jgi:hypothetical protein
MWWSIWVEGSEGWGFENTEIRLRYGIGVLGSFREFLFGDGRLHLLLNMALVLGISARTKWKLLRYS